MADSFQPIRFSPLSDLSQPVGGIALAERLGIGKIDLRGDAGDAAFMSAVEGALGTELPLQPNATRASDSYTVFWLGPDEWLIHCPESSQSETASMLRKSLGEMHVAVTDVSDYYLVIRISGDKAREVLSKGTPFDVHPGVFGRGACAQTRFGHASILLHCVDEDPVFDIQVRWSFGEYLWTFLVDAAREYGG